MRLLDCIPLGAVLLFAGLSVGEVYSQAPVGYPAAAQDSRPTQTASNDSTQGAPASTVQRFAALQQDAKELRKEQVTAQTTTPQDQQKKQLDLLQKQIETQQKMIDLLTEQMKKQQSAPPPSTAATEKLQMDSAILESRSLQAARRDQDIGQAIDTLNEHADAMERNGPQLPSMLKELFLPSGNNETPLSIYGALSVGYQKIQNATPGGFYFGEFTPDFLLKLNDWILLEAEIGIGSDGSVSAGSFAQADFFVNDWLTIIAGRFVAPIGWYNERLNNPWVNKLPTDAAGTAPLLWLQVLPAMSMLGVQAQGSFYLGCSPLKLEYNAYISNGLNLTPATPGMPTIDELANLENMTDTFSIISNDKAIGGRLGLWWPEKGLEAGFSAMTNGDYVAGGSEDSINLIAVDLNYHKGNWDARAEYGMVWQHAEDFIGENIRRQGFYTQVAYRPYDSINKYLQKLEYVYRYSYVDFRGIDPTTLNLSTYASPIDVPVRRQQNEFGINYWFYPRLAMKLAYQINDEPGFHLHDNQFIAELDWGW